MTKQLIIIEIDKLDKEYPPLGFQTVDHLTANAQYIKEMRESHQAKVPISDVRTNKDKKPPIMLVNASKVKRVVQLGKCVNFFAARPD